MIMVSTWLLGLHGLTAALQRYLALPVLCKIPCGDRVVFFGVEPSGHRPRRLMARVQSTVFLLDPNDKKLVKCGEIGGLPRAVRLIASVFCHMKNSHAQLIADVQQPS